MVIWAGKVVEPGDMLVCFDYGIAFRIWSLKDLQEKSSNGTQILNVCETLSTIRCSGFFDANWKMDLSMTTRLLHDIECKKLKVDVPKLRTFVLFKNSYETEPYASVLRNKMAQVSDGSVQIVFYRFVWKLVGLCLSHQSTAFAYCMIFRILNMRLTFCFIVNFTHIIGRTCSRMPNLKLLIFVRWIYKLNSKY